MPLLLERIDALLQDESFPAEAQTVLTIESILTDGYASALALEGERLRIEREMEGVTAALKHGDSSRRAEELATLATRRAEINGDLTHLRDRLGLLRRRVRDLRATLPQPAPEFS